MVRSIHLRVSGALRRIGVPLLCLSLAATVAGMARAQEPTAPQAPVPAQQAPTQPTGSPPSQPDTAAGTQPTSAGVAVHAVEPTPGKRQLREAENAYFAGAKKLEHGDMDGAERDFARALKLDPVNRNYAIAISVARQHRLSDLVRQASKARQAGDQQTADTLLAQARAMDPENPLVAEHSGPFLIGSAVPAQPPATASGSPARMAAATEEVNPWEIQTSKLGGAIRLDVKDGQKSFHLRGLSADVIRQVEAAYGIQAVIDDSVERLQLRLDLDNVNYAQAQSALTSMAHVFMVPEDSTSVIVAKDNATERQLLERQLEETIRLPGYTMAQINELSLMVKNVFNLQQPTAGTGNLVVRAPENVLAPLNRTLQDLIDSPGELMLEIKLYDVEKTRTTNAGGTIPTAYGVYNVDAAATQLVNANQSLVQQAIAQGLISATANNLQIAYALLASGLVQSSLLSSTLGVFGNGLTTTGITETGSLNLSLALNTTDSRALDDMQQRVKDRETAVFREGTKYPITSSTYSSGLSTAASALSNASINGVSVASLLSQYAGGSSATIPQVTYEDLGVTLEATPTIEKSGRINLMLKLKIEALAGGSSDGIPILLSRQFNSDLTVGDGESVLMASAVSGNELTAMTGIPGLSELPGFQMPLEDNLEKDSSQLIVMVTPHIVRRRSDLVAGPRIALHFPMPE